jgi:hypothetical protein
MLSTTAYDPKATPDSSPNHSYWPGAKPFCSAHWQSGAYPAILAAGFEDNQLLIVMLAVAGERDLVNKLVAEVDARPFGFLQLMQMPLVCACGAPFDLEKTPNFAKLIEDASLPWPPASPMAWPLKDW